MRMGLPGKESIIVTARIYEKRGTWQIVLIYKDGSGARKQKWIDTELPIRGNSRRAKKMMEDAIQEWKPVLEPDDQVLESTAVREAKRETHQNRRGQSESGILFSEYLLDWVESRRNRIQPTTFGAYQKDVQSYIAPYFAQKGILVEQMTDKDIADFYRYKRRNGVSENTLLHYQTVLNQALRKAAREKLLPVNPFAVLDKDLKPKHVRYIPQTYDENDLRKMFAAMRGDPMALIILMDVTYGLRRSELLGLKWSAINFKEKSIHICYKVTETLIDGKLVYVKDSLLKNKSSNRTLPLVPSIEEELLRLKFQQNRNRKLYGKAYEQDDRDFVFVNECGKLIKPDYVSRHFQWFLKKNNLKKIRFHDLRHTCATMLCRKKISLQEIQVWLGHSTYQTTADIYTHLNYTDKIGTANAAARIVSDVLGKGGSE